MAGQIGKTYGKTRAFTQDLVVTASIETCRNHDLDGFEHDMDIIGHLAASTTGECPATLIHECSTGRTSFAPPGPSVDWVLQRVENTVEEVIHILSPYHLEVEALHPNHTAARSSSQEDLGGASSQGWIDLLPTGT